MERMRTVDGLTIGILKRGMDQDQSASTKKTINRVQSHTF